METFTSLSPPPVKGIAGGNGVLVGDVEGCKYGCLWLYCWGGIYRTYKLGIKWDEDDFSKIVYNSMQLSFNNSTYDCSDIRFYFQKNYSTPTGTSLVVSAYLEDKKWHVIRANIKLTNKKTFQTRVIQNAIPLDAITLYEDEDFKGKRYILGTGSYSSLPNVGIPNDKISSIRIPAGFEVTLYENGNFQGAQQTLTTNTSRLTNMNNKLSSIKVQYISPIKWNKQIDDLRKSLDSATQAIDLKKLCKL